VIGQGLGRIIHELGFWNALHAGSYPYSGIYGRNSPVFSGYWLNHETMRLAAEMAVFAEVTEQGSFTAAARALGVPKVAVSRAIVSLERALGTRLLERTTRRISITPAGLLLRPFSQRIRAEVTAARRALAPVADSPRELRVATDAGYGRLLVAPLVPRFLEGFPDAALHVSLLDELPIEPQPDWDVLVCNGAPQGTALAATSLGKPALLLCASPAYLRAHGRPERPADLHAHTLLLAAARVWHLKLRHGETTVELQLLPKLSVDDPALVHASTAAGLGIGVLPEFLCRQGLSLGRLERVLPQWFAAELLELHAVYDARRAAAPAIRRFVDFLIANMVPVLGHPA
jgi:DNA-binding transcriptional LysR family regulator